MTANPLILSLESREGVRSLSRTVLLRPFRRLVLTRVKQNRHSQDTHPGGGEEAEDKAYVRGRRVSREGATRLARVMEGWRLYGGGGCTGAAVVQG